jgi:hypothetical protein
LVVPHGFKVRSLVFSFDFPAVLFCSPSFVIVSFSFVSWLFFLSRLVNDECSLFYSFIHSFCHFLFLRSRSPALCTVQGLVY